MTDLPVIVRILKYLRNNRGKGLTEEEIIEGICAEREYVDQALEKLVQKGIVLRENEHYLYQATPWADDFSQKVLTLYERMRIRRRPLKELLIRGAIASQSAVKAEALLKALEEEGINKEEILAFIENEVQKGYIKRMRLVYLDMGTFIIPLAKYFPTIELSWDELAEIRESYRRVGLELCEDVYLIENYPLELARPAREYLKQEWPSVKDKIAIQEMPLQFPSFL